MQLRRCGKGFKELAELESRLRSGASLERLAAVREAEEAAEEAAPLHPQKCSQQELMSLPYHGNFFCMPQTLLHRRAPKVYSS